MRLSSSFPSYAPWIMFGTSFHSSKHTGEVVLWKLCNDICTSITQIQTFPNLTRSGQHDFKYYIESLIVSYVCMKCCMCALCTNTKRFLQMSEGGIGKYLGYILSKYSRYCLLYHWQLNFISCRVSDRVINRFCLWSIQSVCFRCY